MSTQPSETVAAQGLSKVRAGDDEGLAAGGLAERQRRALQKAFPSSKGPRNYVPFLPWNLTKCCGAAGLGRRAESVACRVSDEHVSSV